MSYNLRNEEKNKKSNGEDCKNLFVYGTLRKGKRLNYLLDDLEYKKATLPGFKKLQSDDLGFPVIIKEEDSEVKGEVYLNLSETHFSRIDKTEEENIFFHRIVVDIITSNGNKLKAYVYYPSKKLLKFVFKKK